MFHNDNYNLSKRIHLLIFVALMTIFTTNLFIMDIGKNIKRLREDRGIKQNEIADLIGMHRSNYSKIENGQREISVAALDKIAAYFNISLDELVHLGEDIPQEISVEDKTTAEQVKLIQELDQEEKNMIFKMIDTFLTKKKFKDFFQKNIAAL